MQSAWRVIDCTCLEGSITYERGRIKVTKRDTGEVTEIPLAQAAVVLLGLKSRCSTAVLYELAQYGVSVLLCDWRGVPTAGMYSWTSVPTKVTTRQLAQSTLTRPRKKNAWARVVKEKIRGQAACLDALEIEGGGILRGIAATVRSGDTSNHEGQAAREYWKRIFAHDTDFRRIPGAGTGRNAQLDYAYAVLRGFAVKAVISAGLAPPFGINHHGRGNYFCLADDIIEVFRPAIDYQVAQLKQNDTLEDKEVKRYLVDSVNQQFDDSGLTIPSALQDFAQQFGLYCEGIIDVLPVPTYRGPYAY